MKFKVLYKAFPYLTKNYRPLITPTLLALGRYLFQLRHYKSDSITMYLEY